VAIGLPTSPPPLHHYTFGRGQTPELSTMLNGPPVVWAASFARVNRRPACLLFFLMISFSSHRAVFQSGQVLLNRLALVRDS